MAIGLYVGAATVGSSSYWFLYDVTGPQVSYYQVLATSQSWRT